MPRVKSVVIGDNVYLNVWWYGEVCGGILRQIAGALVDDV